MFLRSIPRAIKVKRTQYYLSTVKGVEDNELFSRFLIVENLPPEVTWRELKDHMKIAGQVSRSHIIHDSDKNPSGIVTYDNVHGALTAMKLLQSSNIKGNDIILKENIAEKMKQLRLMFKFDKEKSPSEEKYLLDRIAVVENISPIVSWKDINAFLSKHFNLRHSEVFSYKNGKALAFIKFFTATECQAACKEFADCEFFSTRVKFRPITKDDLNMFDFDKNASKMDSNINSLFIGNLPFSIRENELKDLIDEIRPIESLQLKYNNRGTFAGWGIVRLKNADDAKIIIDKLDRAILSDRSIIVREDRDTDVYFHK